ncbi:Nucleotide-binding universal stress protein, UspA family [Anaerosphaera aminiphila DSM 21120]|uniref:Universal stress protein n=1 Tax=Anaerosphaera aminiphila DSM 21120 TaxID=1120995 RepID=A0A1M5TC06_9FIRM|nr:universal stress protein [Anaerosphaera aminiphila]SHH47873.1 Nucleotide-binding universal stress protein, UspA family [Anaerosphaera aminiphila DSM 21120]
MKILIPVDGSKITKEVIEKAKTVGEKFEAKLLLLTVLDNANMIDRYSYPVAYDSKVKLTEDMLKDLKEDYSDYPYGIETFMRVGMPYNEIIKVADEEDVDLIVMGNRGLGAFSRTFLGSVSNKVLNHSDKSILIVKADIEEE